jgi:hypothetical protein
MTPSSSDARPTAARAVGSVLAGCRIEAVLHVGPVFTVYRAGDALGGGRYALKEYCPQALCVRDTAGAPMLRDPDDAAARAAFDAGRVACLEELRLLARLRLPGLVPVLQASQEQGCPCALMPLLPGVPLSRREPPRGDETLRELLLTLLEPLSQVHAAGLVHGGLHGDQLLWASGQRPVLLGFGFAARALRLPQALAHAAPELRPEGAHLPRGPWTDLYALAATVLGQVTGHPWDASASVADIAAALDAALPSPAGAGRAALAQALHDCLRTSPTERPDGALALRALLAGGHAAPASARRPPSAAPGVPPPLREPAGPLTHAAAARAAVPPAGTQGPPFSFLAPEDAVASLGSGSPSTSAGAASAGTGSGARPGAAAHAGPAGRRTGSPTGDSAAAGVGAGIGSAAPAGASQPSLAAATAASVAAGVWMRTGAGPGDEPGSGLGPDFAADAGLRASRPAGAPPRPDGPSPRALVAGAAAALLLAVGVGYAAWWVHGLWQAEQERDRLGRLMAEAAAQAAASAPTGGVLNPAAAGLGAADDGPDGDTRALAGSGPAAGGAASAGVLAPSAGAGLPGASSAATVPGTPAAGAWPSAPSALGLPQRAAVPTEPAAATGQTAPPAAGAHPGGSTPARQAPARREPESGRATAQAAGTEAPEALLASLPPTPLAACVSLAKSALERCLREQCAKDAWRSHALCRPPRADGQE